LKFFFLILPYKSSWRPNENENENENEKKKRKKNRYLQQKQGEAMPKLRKLALGEAMSKISKPGLEDH
jgi:hypothetical protein